MSSRSGTSGTNRFDVVVLGAGPAGAAAALQLARLGYAVAIASLPRVATIEGLSARATARLSAVGLHTAGRCVSLAAPRFVCWASERALRGEEYLIAREDFDQALRVDLKAGDVECIDAAVNGVGGSECAWQIQTSDGPVYSRAVVDARGRRARRSDHRGPRLVAWNAIYRCAADSPPATAVVAFDAGWCWFARTGTGLLSAQYIGAPRERFSTGRFAEMIRRATLALPEFDLSVENAVPIGKAHARAAVARYTHPAQAPGYLRIGDASVAMDPLSGNGVYEALGSAQVAVAAINTHLSGAEWSAVARFVDERAAELWRRSVGTAGSFYRLQAGHSAGEFWRATASAYESLALNATPVENGPGRFEFRPVLNHQRIEIRKVWVSAAWPRGIWARNGGESGERSPPKHEV